MSKTDGGQAFPVPASYWVTGDPFNREKPGMTLRDYFAAHAPVTTANFIGGEPTAAALEKVAAERARYAYAYADAMLAERSK